jgi:hypothetical protein
VCAQQYTVSSDEEAIKFNEHAAVPIALAIDMALALK